MELARELLSSGASGDMLDNILPAEAQRSEDKRPSTSFWTKLAACMALVPAIDFVSDFAMFTALLSTAQFDWALGVAVVTVLFLRFSCLYTAMVPALTLRNMVVLYVPCMLLPLHDRLIGHVTGGDVQKLYVAASTVSAREPDPERGAVAMPVSITAFSPMSKEEATQPPTAQQRERERNNENELTHGPHASWLRGYVLMQYARYKQFDSFVGVHALSWVAKLFFVIVTEIELNLWCFFMGVRQVFDSTTDLAIFKLEAHKCIEPEKREFYLRVPLFIQAGLASTAQVALATTFAFTCHTSINESVLYTSIACSWMSMATALYHFGTKCTSLVDPMSPSAAALKLRLCTLVKSADVESTALSTLIHAIMEKDATVDTEVAQAIWVLRAARIKEVEQRIETAGATAALSSALRREGYVWVEMQAAGYDMADLITWGEVGVTEVVVHLEERLRAQAPDVEILGLLSPEVAKQESADGASLARVAAEHAASDAVVTKLLEGFESVPNEAFLNCQSLRSVTVPCSSTRIGASAFAGSSLASVRLPTSITEIGEHAFNGCTDLKAITIPSSVVQIGANAFFRCMLFVSVTIPPSVTHVGEWAFYGCSSLKSITIPSSVAQISDNVLAGCVSLSSIHIPPSVKLIGASAFFRCASLKSVNIPSSVTQIGSSAFSGCSALTSVTIPSSVTQIGDNAFAGCSALASATIPSSVTQISPGTFHGCSSLASIFIPASITRICECAFNGCEALPSVAIPSSVTQIGYSAFDGCSSLASVTMPPSLTEIGHSAFYGCASLKFITIPSTVTQIGKHAFYNCVSLVCVTIPSSIKNTEDLGISKSTNISCLM